MAKFGQQGEKMGLGLGLEMSQALKLRQVLEASLELRVYISARLELKIYQQREQILTRLYRKALKKGNVREYNKHGMKFEFALVSIKDVPRQIYEQSGFAFSHCLMRRFDVLFQDQRYAKGSWLLFVIYDMYPDMPTPVLEYAAVHERGEMVTFGDHNLASKLEFAIVVKEKKLKWYMNWIEDNCPEKFADVFIYQVHLQLPKSEEMEKLLKIFQTSEEAQKVKRMIEEFEWPYKVLQRLNKYRKANDEVSKIFILTFRAARTFVLQSHLLAISETITKVRELIENGLQKIVDKGLQRYISTAYISNFWKRQRIDLDLTFFKMLDRKQKIMNEKDYTGEVIGFGGELPRDGILSMDFKEVLK